MNEFVKADKSQDVSNKQEFEHWLTTTFRRAATRSPEAIGTATRSATNEVTRDQLKKLAVTVPFVRRVWIFGQCCYDHCGFAN